MSDVKPLLNMDSKMNASMVNEESFVRVRGLPFSTTAAELVDFFSDVVIVGGENGVTFTFTRDGRASGEAYICVASADDKAAAINHNREHIGNRYIEVFEANREEMEYVVRKNGPNPVSSTEGVLRMRGLPFGCSKEEIVQFFTGYEIVPNGITMTVDMHGRTSGDAYVQFSSQEVAENAITEKHMKRIGHRYIELFRSTSMEAKQAAYGGMPGGPPGRNRPMRPAPYERPDRYGGPRVGSYDSYPPQRERFSGERFGNGVGGGAGGAGRFKELTSGERYSGSSRGSSRGGMRGRGGGRGGRGGGANGSNYISGTGHSVHMRGLPFAADEMDVARFFTPLRPFEVVMGLNSEGRKSGEADVDFETHEEACEAMKKDKSHMEHRYIELFLNSSSHGTSRSHNNTSIGFGSRDDYSSSLPGPSLSRSSYGGGMGGGGMGGGGMGSGGMGGGGMGGGGMGGGGMGSGGMGASNLGGGSMGTGAGNMNGVGIGVGSGLGGGLGGNLPNGTSAQGIFGFGSMGSQGNSYY